MEKMGEAMDEARRKQRNRQRLSELYPPFAERIKAVIKELEKVGYRPRIQEAYRPPQDQLKAFNTGNSKVKFGFHNVTGANGKPESLAVDLYDDDRPLSPTTAYFLHLSAIAWKLGLATGVLWGLDARQRRIVEAAITEERWGDKVRTGWDSWHIEPADIAIAEAKRGKRPTFSSA